jgi:hypothetical protein
MNIPTPQKKYYIMHIEDVKKYLYNNDIRKTIADKYPGTQLPQSGISWSRRSFNNKEFNTFPNGDHKIWSSVDEICYRWNNLSKYEKEKYDI